MRAMKVVGVISSGHVNGNTASLVREALNGARDAGAATEEIFLPALDIRFCTGCLRCSELGECVQDDDFEKVRRSLSEADGIILSSPTFGAAPCARMKNLFDRLGLFEYMTSSVFGGKYVAAISTAKSFGARDTVKQLTGLPLHTVFQRAYVSGGLGVILRGGKEATDFPQFVRQSRSLGQRVARDVQQQRRYPMQNLGSRLMNTMMRPMLSKGIAQYKDTQMAGVYQNLVRRGLIS